MSDVSGAAEPTQVVILTGMSGAGRSTAAHAMEDLGWYVVDNLPPSMMPALLDTALERGFTKVAVIVDVRTRSEFDEIPVAFETLTQRGVLPQILFLEAPDDVIVRRQESVRRPHPLQGDGPLLDGIRRERKMLAVLRAAADMVIDTGRLNVHQLASRVVYAFNADVEQGLHVTLMSFGFKNGIPMDADLVLDVRFLPNPHWVPELRPQTGLSQSVSSYVLGFDEAREFLDSVVRLLLTMTPGYVREGKRLATVAIGCTGGKHRSTAMAEELARRLTEERVDCNVLHRDLGLE